MFFHAPCERDCVYKDRPSPVIYGYEIQSFTKDRRFLFQSYENPLENDNASRTKRDTRWRSVLLNRSIGFPGTSEKFRTLDPYRLYESTLEITRKKRGINENADECLYRCRNVDERLVVSWDHRRGVDRWRRVV